MASVTQSDRVNDVHRMVDFLKDHQAFERKQYPVTSTWASRLGHACERNIFYHRTEWDKAQVRDWKGIGERGNLIADWWKRRMMEKGFSVIHDQLPLSKELRDKYQISGKIDGRIGWAGIKPVLYEFKTMNQYHYEKVNSYLDIADSKVPYIKMYAAQLQIYLLDNNEEAGLFILCNPLTLEWKMIPMYLDYGYCEWLLKRAERINKALVTKIPPDRILYNPAICGQCEFSLICLPGVQNEGVPLIDNDYLEAVLRERKELEDKARRYDELDKEAKALARGVGKDFIVNTTFKVEVKKTQGTKIDVDLIPIEIASRFEVPQERVRINFIPLTGGGQ